jgi:dihydroorotate dehydrogenase electron transfer subunit
MSSSQGVFDCEVLSIKNFTGRIFLMRLHAPGIAKSVKAGQFVNIKVNSEYIPLLRKPFSVCRRDVAEGWIEVLWEVVGKGTSVMSQFSPGHSISIIGPLGHGYSMADDLEHAFLVAGGLGVAPLPFLYETISENPSIEIEVFLGARSVHHLSMVDFFRERGAHIQVMTDDGSAGRMGLVTEPVIERLLQAGADTRRMMLYSCGPTPFLNAMAEISTRFDVPGEIAIETMMGCGIGICVGCPVRVRTPPVGEKLYKLTCVEGPVFRANEVVLHG